MADDLRLEAGPNHLALYPLLEHRMAFGRREEQAAPLKEIGRGVLRGQPERHPAKPKDVFVARKLHDRALAGPEVIHRGALAVGEAIGADLAECDHGDAVPNRARQHEGAYARPLRRAHFAVDRTL